MAPRVPLRLALIGNFALWRRSHELEIASSGQRLIALLALRGPARSGGFTWPELSGRTIYWPDYLTERSLATLRTTLWRVIAGVRVPLVQRGPQQVGEFLVAQPPRPGGLAREGTRSRIGAALIQTSHNSPPGGTVSKGPSRVRHGSTGPARVRGRPAGQRGRPEVTLP